MLIFSTASLAQSPDGLYDMDVLNANPHLIQRFPGEVAPSNRTIIIVGSQGRIQTSAGEPVPIQYQGDLFDLGEVESNIEVDTSTSFQQTSRRVEKKKPAGPSFSDVAQDVNSRGRLDLAAPTASRRVRDIQLYDF